jgi:hypothetical protein
LEQKTVTTEGDNFSDKVVRFVGGALKFCRDVLSFAMFLGICPVDEGPELDPLFPPGRVTTKWLSGA